MCFGLCQWTVSRGMPCTLYQILVILCCAVICVEYGNGDEAGARECLHQLDRLLDKDGGKMRMEEDAVIRRHGKREVSSLTRA